MAIPVFERMFILLYVLPFVNSWTSPLNFAQTLVKKVEMERIAKEKNSAIKFVDDLSKATSQRIFWETLVSTKDPSILAFPESDSRDVKRLYNILLDAAPVFHNGEELRVEVLANSPLNALSTSWKNVPKENIPLERPKISGVKNRMKHWVDRTLVKLRMCPFTRSSDLSGQNLEEFGVTPAPIQYVESDSTSIIELMADFWAAVDNFLQAGEEGASSIIMSAPHWDDEKGWDDWYHRVFPVLEESVICAKLSREVGIVCFHPLYSTPDKSFLLKHRFGHMYAPEKLFQWVQAKDKKFAEKITLLDLHWAGSYQRRSPHAMINVLWASQLEAAENKRDSDNLYVRNVKKLLKEGKEKLDREAAEEKVL
mmetsp:Transcript_25558/g.33425  ORF Transcript_25558/g.33425 Transcript_25558/m.33425 type:complete len:368 (-) Transcript_25558:191-1294(-)